MAPHTAHRGWLGAALVLTALKLWLTSGQTIFAIGPALHDDRLFVELAARVLEGDWLGPYNQFTLAKGPMFPVFIAAVFWLGLPLLLAQQALYAGACAILTHALKPWLRPGAAQFSFYTLLLWNPMSFDAGNLSRLMRQNLYTPLALLVVAGLVQLFARRHESWGRQAGPAILGGLAFGAFWLTREESVWLLPVVGMLLAGFALAPGRSLRDRWRPAAASLALFTGLALLPTLIVSTLNHRHYGWFGTVEFRAAEFKAAYGALTRPVAGPDLPQVPVTRAMREAAYAHSPAFARLRPWLEGPVGDQWSEKTHFPAADRQMRGGWFVWALRDAVVAAGLAPDAGAAMRYYQQVADELNQACDTGRLPARPRRDGFLPRLDAGLVRPLTDGALEYGAFFLGFSNFTAYSPESIGDYAELKPFRNLVGTRLSHAPRSPDPAPPEQAALDAWKLSWLEKIGVAIGRLLAWLGPLVLLVGVVRVVESALDRRLSFCLGLAAALLAGCAAYLTINVLVHVTSFYNMSPAALAAAYPLYLAALAAIVCDAASAWRRLPPAPAAPGLAPAPSRWVWLVPAGAALVVFAARLREIHLHAGDVPYNDQWFIEARQIIAPWLEGTLGLGAFFAPHFEHLPVWTRLLVWLQVVFTGRWDPLVQMTVNAGLHTLFVWLVMRWVWQGLPVRRAGLVTFIVILGGALPHAWENIAWGFQSQFPIALIFLFWHVRGACVHPVGSRGWWLAQAAAVAGCLTLASAWVAPLAVVAVQLWIRPRDWRGLAVPLIIGATGIAVLALIHAQSSAGGSFAQLAQSPTGFAHSAMHLLGWPSGLPGALAVLQLPWLIHAFRLRGQPDTSSFDRIVCALGLWSCAQAFALALARSGETGDYTSRYGDLLFIGVLASAAALTRLTFPTDRLRPLFVAGFAAWVGLVLLGLVVRSTEGHARYFHQNSGRVAALRLEAVQAYLRTGDKTLLEKPETRWVLTQNPEVVTQLLDQPAFRALLPSTVNPASPADYAGRFVRALQARWSWLLLGGGLVLAAGAGFAVWRGSPALPLAPLPVAADAWPGRIALVIGLFSGAMLFSWGDPLTFNQEYRWRQLLGGDQAVTGLTFAFAGPSPFGSERLQGAAPIQPVPLRNQFYGTAPAGPGLTCAVISSPFLLKQAWLVVPYAGYPVGHGNGLRLRILAADGREVLEEIGCPGPNIDGIAYWTVDVRAHQGRQAQLVLYDGRTETEAWVAAAPPIPSDSAELAPMLTQRLQGENHAGMHTSLGIMALVSLGCALILWLRRRL